MSLEPPFTDRRRSLFTRHVDAYEQGRPGYPDEVYRLLVDRCGLGPGSRVMEIGPGTGQATEPLLDAGAAVVAVEAGAEMADRLAAKYQNRNLEVLVGRFESVDLPDGPFDLAVSATAFHWVPAEVGLTRIGSRLAPDGWLAL